MSVYSRWYKDGTIAATNGSPNVTGSNTYWATAGLNPGDIVKIGGVDYELLSVEDNTHITLATNFKGNTASGLGYSIVRNFTATSSAKVAAQAAGLMGDFERYVDKEMQKINGKSAYEVAVANGYTGTAAQWLESLKAGGEWTAANTRISSLEDRVGRNNAGAHNSIYRGKNLGVFTEAHSAAIRNGTFEDMYVGDWFTCPSAYKNTIWGDTAFLIAGFNLFNGAEAGNHVVLIANRRDFSHPLNKSYIDTTTIGYANCNWRNEYRPEYEEAAGHIFLDESHLSRHREVLSTAHNGRIITESVIDNDSCCEILDLANITGFMTLEHTASTGTAGNSRAFPNGGIFPLFALNRRALNIPLSSFTRTRTFEANNLIYCWSELVTIRTNSDNTYGITTNPYITIN